MFPIENGSCATFITLKKFKVKKVILHILPKVAISASILMIFHRIAVHVKVKG